MTNITKIEEGLGKYIDQEILPVLSDNQLEKFAVGIAVKNEDEYLIKYLKK